MAEAHAHPHTHEEKKFSPTAEVKEVGPCKLQIRIEVSAARVKEEIEHKYKDLNDSMALPGFRKGHAPRNVLERKFGKALLDDLKFEMLSGSFEEVKEEKKLEPVGEPETLRWPRTSAKAGTGIGSRTAPTLWSRPLGASVLIRASQSSDTLTVLISRSKRPASCLIALGSRLETTWWAPKPLASSNLLSLEVNAVTSQP